jgi:hypothetical protein
VRKLSFCHSSFELISHDLKCIAVSCIDFGQRLAVDFYIKIKLRLFSCAVVRTIAVHMAIGPANRYDILLRKNPEFIISLGNQHEEVADADFLFPNVNWANSFCFRTLSLCGCCPDLEPAVLLVFLVWPSSLDLDSEHRGARHKKAHVKIDSLVRNRFGCLETDCGEMLSDSGLCCLTGSVLVRDWFHDHL